MRQTMKLVAERAKQRERTNFKERDKMKEDLKKISAHLVDTRYRAKWRFKIAVPDPCKAEKCCEQATRRLALMRDPCKEKKAVIIDVQQQRNHVIDENQFTANVQQQLDNIGSPTLSATIQVNFN